MQKNKPAIKPAYKLIYLLLIFEGQPLQEPEFEQPLQAPFFLTYLNAINAAAAITANTKIVDINDEFIFSSPFSFYPIYYSDTALFTSIPSNPFGFLNNKYIKPINTIPATAVQTVGAFPNTRTLPNWNIINAIE